MDPTLEINLSEIFLKKCTVDSISIKGLQRTREHIVERNFDGLREAQTLDEIKDAVLQAHADLMALGVFSAVEIILDHSKISPTEGCSVVVRCQESSLLNVHTGTYVQGTEGTVEASLNLNNPLGRAEQVSFGLEYGTQRTNVASLSYSMPKPWGMPVMADVRVQQLVTDRQSCSSYVERLRGGIVTVASETGSHALSYELGWRRLNDPSQRCSRLMIDQLGDQVKSALKYNFSTGTLDGTAFPRNGWSLRTSAEFSGIGPDPNLVRFAKHQISGVFALPVGEDSALHLEGGAGILLPWGGQKRTYISDRFFLGGVCPDALRGFAIKGVGPSAGRRPRPVVAEGESRSDALGGDVMWSILAALRYNLPNDAFRAAGLKGQVFVNFGNLAPVTSPRRTAADLFSNFRCSVGVGIVWPISVGMLEVNLTRVLRRRGSDRIAQTGLQFGFSASI